MKNKVRIGWDISHLEFTIEDHYYFSKLKTEIIKAGSSIREVKILDDIMDYDVVVFNYPEKPFKKKELVIINRYLKRGGKAVIAGYYNNEDHIADCINSLTYSYGIELGYDQIKDRNECLDGDELLVVTDKIEKYNAGVNRVMFPCCASIKIEKHSGVPFIHAMGGGYSINNKVIGVEVKVDNGILIVIGTCVFWDNYAISKYSNLRFSLNLLLN